MSAPNFSSGGPESGGDGANLLLARRRNQRAMARSIAGNDLFSELVSIGRPGFTLPHLQRAS